MCIRDSGISHWTVSRYNVGVLCGHACVCVCVSGNRKDPEYTTIMEDDVDNEENSDLLNV